MLKSLNGFCALQNNPAAESVGDAVCGRRKFSKIYIDYTEGSRKTNNSGWESYARAGPIPAEFPGHPIFYVWRGIYAPQVGDQSETWTCGLAKPEDGLSIKNLKKQNQRIFIDRALIDRVPDPTLSP